MSFLERISEDKAAYEENLSKFKDERDAIQKKTFTKWVNKHLKKANRHVNDLFTDLQDGLNLICLLEVLSGEHLPREKGRMRFHMLQNVELVLNFLRYKKIKLVNIRPEDIVDGNPKLTLGLIWTIILHFQISDIVVGEEPNVSARDVLLRWARNSTSHYPGVKVSDFTNSWRDGLAFNAVLHRNRPDLLPEWREIRRRSVRERLETAFYTAEKVGVTRLLDPEDVDTHEIDEKSIITYISSLYDAFPDPPSSHPLHDNEGADLTREYREVASSLHMWLRQRLADFGPRDWAQMSSDELRRAANESSRFLTQEVPLRANEKMKLQSLYRDLQKIYETTGEVDIEPELHIDVLERNWTKLLALHQKHDLAVQDELKKWDRSGRLADKVLRECKRLEPRLDDLDSRISTESTRIERLHPLDGKHVCDSIESELRSIDDNIQSLFQDVKTLKSGGHPQYPDLNKRVQRLHQRWVQLRSALHSKLISRLASMSFPVVEERTVTRETRTILETRLVDTNHHFRQLQEALDWLKAKLKQLQEAEFSSDLQKAKKEFAQHQRDHREIDRFQSTIDHCIQAKNEFSGEELALYTQHLSSLQRLYAELLALSNKRISEYETLLDFLESVASQLANLREKENIEVARDWSDPNLNLPPVQAYYENLMMELERMENVVRSLLERGESLLLQGHPASKAISAVLGELQSSWSRVLQYTLALETHIATTQNSQAFYRDLNNLKDWIHSRDEILNTTYSSSEFSLDEGERLLRGMQELRDELNLRAEEINGLSARAATVAPLKQRRSPVIRPIQLQAICDYKSAQVEIEKGDQWTLHDNSALTKWRVSPIGSTKDTNVPGVVFLIPPPSKEARDAVESLAKDFERTLSLWQRKQLRLRQNMIFTTIRVVRSWDLNQFVAMGADQRNAIRKALNEDADKLLNEGDPNDPQLRRLKREMAEVNRLFDEFEALANQQEENKNSIRIIMEKSTRLQEALDEAERTLNLRLGSSIPRDVHSLEHLVIQHKEFETSLKNLTPEVEALQASFNNLTRKTPGVQTKVEGILQQWNQIWNYSHLYVERLKCVEITLGAIDEATNVVSELELKLASFGEMPSELQPLQNVHDDLIRLQNDIASQQPVIDQLIEDARNTRKIVVKSREKLRNKDFPDLDRLDSDVNSVTQRWNNLCASLVDRLRCCEAAYSLLDSYGKTYQTEIKFVDESYSELNNLPPLSTGKQIVEPTKVLFTSIVERTQPLEQVNIDGGRFIREAKIYNLALEKFRSLVQTWQPSYVPETQEPGYKGGEEFVTEQLDHLNHRYLALVSILQDRLRQIAAVSNDEDLLQEIAHNLKPLHLKTFRTEFTLTEASTQLSNRWREADEADMGLNGSSLPKTGIGTPLTQKKGIFDPSTKQELTIEEAIKSRLLDVRNGSLNLPDGRSVPISEGTHLGIIEKSLCDELLGPSKISGSKNLLEAIQRELHLAEGFKISEAMEEKYKFCDDNLRSLLDWLNEIETRLSNLEPASEDFDRLKNQVDFLKLIKEELDSQGRTVGDCLDEARNISNTGHEYLTEIELKNLDRNSKSLRTRYDRANDKTDKLLRRLANAGDHLGKFRSETKTFTDWMVQTERLLDEKEGNIGSLKENDKSVRELLGDVIGRQADLRFISMAANKFFEESKEFLLVLNDFRTSMSTRLPHIDLSLSSSEIKSTVNRISADYRRLLGRANALSDRVSGLNARLRDFQNALQRFSQWMSSAEPRALKVCGESMAGDPQGLEEQLNRAKNLNNEFLAQGRLIDNLKQAMESLPPETSKAAEKDASDIISRYTSHCGNLSDRVAHLESAFSQSQGVEASLDSLNQWLAAAENNFKIVSRPVSLSKDRLDDHVKELRLLLSDIETRSDSVHKTAAQARALISAQAGSRLANRVGSKLQDVLSRFEKLSDRSSKRSELVGEIQSALTSFSSSAAEVENWLLETAEIIASNSSMDVIVDEREKKRDLVERVLRDGRALISKKDVTDTGNVRDRIKNIESGWREILSLLEERERLRRSRAETSQTYEKLKDQVLGWLQSMESRIAALEPIALQNEIILRQINEIKPLIKEHKDYGATVDKLFDLGSNLESAVRADSPRRYSASPIKRLSSSQLLRRNSQEGSVSPSRIFSVSSPVAGRRSSQEIFTLQEMVGIGSEIGEITRRYSGIGTRLADRHNGLDLTRDELRRATDLIKSLDAFLERVSRSTPKDGLPSGRDEADSILKVLKGILEELYEKQATLESAKSAVSELVKKRGDNALGAPELKDQLSKVSEKWRQLHESLKARLQFLEDAKDVFDSYDLLSSWLSAKERMLLALGPISPESRMVQVQIEQVVVLKEEMRATRPQLDHLIQATAKIASAQTPDSQKLRKKVEMITQRWEDLGRKLEDRLQSLGAAVDSSKSFDQGLSRLRQSLSKISSEVDGITTENPTEALRKIQGCERQVEGLRSLLADAESAGAELAALLTDPLSKSDIQGKLADVRKQYSALQDKLDHRKAEIQALLRDDREVEASIAKTSGWLTGTLGTLSKPLLVSADRDLLQSQLQSHTPIYKEILGKEHEVILLLEKVSGRKESEGLRGDWERLRREATDRMNRLQTSWEHCKKYHKSLESFVPWLTQVENKLDNLKPDSFQRRDVDKFLRDLANIRNDVWKKSGEFEHVRMLCETFLASTDIDKDLVIKELTLVKERWERLNNELLEKTSRLEDLRARISEASERLRLVSHEIQRCEDRLTSHDSLTQTPDPATLVKLKGLRDDVHALKAPLSNLTKVVEDLDRDVESESDGRTSGLMDEVVGLGERLDDLSDRLRDRCLVAESAAIQAQNYNDKVKLLTGDLSALEAELASMKPPAREIKLVQAQINELVQFGKKVARASDEVTEASELANRLIDSGVSIESTRKGSDSLKSQLSGIKEKVKARDDDLRRTESALANFLRLLDDAQHNLDTCEKELSAIDKRRGSAALGADEGGETLRRQQTETERICRDLLEPAGRSVRVATESGRALINSATAGVSTQQISQALDDLTNRWDGLNANLVEREQKLNSALLQSGKFKEALDGLIRWLTDTEEMVAHQRPPAADYNVVKAQLQEQKFLIKMINDREESLDSLERLGREMSHSDVSQKLSSIRSRFDNLSSGANTRMADLERTLQAAKRMQEKLTPIVEWLDSAERKIKDLELVPTDEEKIQQRIREHNGLHSEILRKKPLFSELTDLGSELMSLVGDEEAGSVADRVQLLADRYTSLVDASENIGRLLESSRSGLRHLVLTYQGLQGWMEGMEERLNRHRILPVHTDRLLSQMDELVNLTEEISRRQADVDSTVDSGVELMRHISSDEAIQLKEKLDSLQRRYNSLTSRGSQLLRQYQEGLPLVEQFHQSHNKLLDWIQGAESVLQSAEPSEDAISALEQDIQEFRPIVENINQIGGQLCTLSPGEGAASVEAIVTRDNRRFDSVCDQIQRKAERLHLAKQRSREVLGDLDSLLEWFREADANLRDADPPSAEPDIIRLQLKEARALADDIASQRGRVRDLLQAAKKIVREASPLEDSSVMRDKMAELREAVETVWQASCDRLSMLERALGLAEHLTESHNHLSSWLGEMENSTKALPPPSIRPDLIAQQQDRTELLLQSLAEHKPLVEKLNKTGDVLKELVTDEDAAKVNDLLERDNQRYDNLRESLRQRQATLEQALQESSRATDKLEGMLRALTSTKDELLGLGPVSSQPPRLREQISELGQLSDQLRRREEAFTAVKAAAEEVIGKAASPHDPAVKDVRRKLEKLESLWSELQKATSSRGNSLSRALEVATEFWSELESVMGTLADLEASLASQQPPAARPQQIAKQQAALKEIKAEIEQTKPEVESVRKSGAALMSLCGESERPEVRKQIEELDSAWDTVTAAFARREENLIDAMERAMEFHGALEEISELLGKSEARFERLGPIGADIGAVKRQIEELKDFKAEVDPHMVKVEALNRQAGELSERTSAEESQALRVALSSINQRWDQLNRGMGERGRQLEQSLLRLGQFQHALAELIQWIANTEATLDDDIRPVIGDPHLLQVQLAKLKVLVNDIQAHQNSVDTLNDAGRQLVETGSVEALPTQEKLNLLNRRWEELLGKVASRRSELEEALRDAQRFSGEVGDMLSWLGEVDGIVASTKPGGGLPETAQDQLERFMEVYNEIEGNRPKVEALLAQGGEFLKRAEGPGGQALGTNLRALKQRWDAVQSRANDKKIKLEIALKEAMEFHNQLQSFVDWLTNAEKSLSNLRPVSRVLETILAQIEEHKSFQKEVGVKRETMLQLDKKGTHLKYFSQKQDVILIKNLLISVQHRWERVVSKSAERTRALDHGYKEAKEFHDMWSSLMSWLTDTDRKLDEIKEEILTTGQDPIKLKQRLAKHKETQKALAAKQGQYDQTMRAGKVLKERAPKTDESKLKSAINQLRDLWTLVSQKAVSGQRSLEEALLFCGQLKDAVESLLDWLKKTERHLTSETKIHGDLDTVQGLIEKHKTLEEELRNRSGQVVSLERSARDIPESETGQLRSQIRELSGLWDRVTTLSDDRSRALVQALKQAEELHKSVHMLLEWLSDAEMRLRFVENLPDDEAEAIQQITEHEKFLSEMRDKELDKKSTVSLAERTLALSHPDGVPVIRHWVTIIQSRWEELTAWANQRTERLEKHLATLRSIDSALEELLSWVGSRENKLREADSRELPDTAAETKELIAEHDFFMEETMSRETEVNTVFRAKQIKKQTTAKKSREEIRQSNLELNELQRRQSLKSSREHLSTLDRKSSRASSVLEEVHKIGPKFAPKGNKNLEPQFKCQRSRLLYEKWRSLWEGSWSRSRKLADHLAHLEELERLANFSWDQWRKRFLKFMNHKKSRLTDLFRKMDKNNDGLIPRDDFINGIINTKFDSSRMEMGAVADMFDHNSEGYIDWKEFIAALRPDWVETKPETEAEKIHDEVKRLVMLCTCRQKFRVFQVGEGKYRFGDSQKLRLVRILRSTVMVRVGGGWVALEEFLVKNDPCRAKGRTNIELREQFILADGVSQSMSAFKPKTSKSPGPITKIREKSERSVPMTPGRRSTEPGRTPTRSSTPGSAPTSRAGSRPISRHSSTLSLTNSEDGSTPSRIPRLSKTKTSTVSNGSSSGTRSPAGSRTPSGAKTPSGIKTPSAGSKTPTAGSKTPSTGSKTPRRESFKL